jgi:hypothetical protein
MEGRHSSLAKDGLELLGILVVSDDTDQPDVASEGRDVDGDVGSATGEYAILRVQQDRNRRLGRNAIDLTRQVMVDHDISHDRDGFAMVSVGRHHQSFTFT